MTHTPSAETRPRAWPFCTSSRTERGRQLGAGSRLGAGVASLCVRVCTMSGGCIPAGVASTCG
eukprot:3254929-Prymnesium_polylepis.1